MLRLLSSQSSTPIQGSSAPSPRPTSAAISSQSSRLSRTRAAGRRGPQVSTAQVEENTRPVRRQKLQEEKLKHNRLFETQVEVIKTAEGIGGKKYKCKRCGTIRTTEILIKSHAANCGKPFKGKRRGKNAKAKFTCNQCPWRAGTKAALAKHRRENHVPVGRLRHRCTTCNKAFSFSQNLKRHLLLHMKRVFTCKGCSMQFSRSDNLKRHVCSHLETGAAELRLLGQASVSGMQSQVEQVDAEPDQMEQVDQVGSGSRWDRFLPGETDGSSSEDDELHHVPLTVAEENRNSRLSVLSQLLTSYGRSIGESEAEIERVQACLRERMCQPHNQPRARVESEVTFIWKLRIQQLISFYQDGSEDIVRLQLKPGVQYILDVPKAVPPPQPAVTPASTPATPRAASARNFPCNVCGKGFRDNFNLIGHIESMHTVKVDSFPCR